jgi:hypothetical protein
MIKAGPKAMSAKMNIMGMVVIRLGVPSIPPNIPPWNMKERPRENAASDTAKSLISVFEKCQNEPVCRAGAGLYACVNPRLKGLN